MFNTIIEFSQERRKTFLVCFLFLALSVRLCVVFFYTIFPPESPGTVNANYETDIPAKDNDYDIDRSFRGIEADHEYGIIARAIADGKGYSFPTIEFDRNHIPRYTADYKPTANQTPFFPYFLSLFYSFSRGPIAFFFIRFTHAVLSALTCIVVYIIALRFIHYKAGIILGMLLSFYPIFILLTVQILPETLFTFFLSLTILYLFLLKGSPSVKNIVITGLLMGITLLNNNVITPFLPLAGVWLLLNLKETLRNKLLKISLVFFISIVVITPWLVRNYLVFHKFPLLKSTTGSNLWLGNNPLGSGTFFSKNGEDLTKIPLSKIHEGFKQRSEIEQDTIFYREATGYIKANRLHYLNLVFKRFYYYWWFPPNKLISENTTSYKKLMLIPYTIILILCIIGILNIMRNNWKNCLLLLALILSISLLYSLFVVGHLRYRLPLEPYILLFASQAIFLFIKRISGLLPNLNKHYI